MFQRFLKSSIRLQDKKLADVHIIHQLTALRISGYSTQNMTQINENQFPQIKELVINLGSRILKENIESNTALDEALLQYKARMNTLFDSKQKLSILSFACQLLQYFTITCDNEFDTEFDIQKLIAFLEKNKTKFGSVHDNLFITEYLLIKIYNEIVYLLDSENGAIAPANNKEKKINFILVHLSNIAKIIEHKILTDTENAFLYYLNFAHKYTCAKLFEFLFVKHKLKSEDNDKISVLETQKVLLHAAKSSLENFDTLTAKELTSSSIKGIEYSYGRNILSKMPITNIELAKDHLHSLTINQ